MKSFADFSFQQFTGFFDLRDEPFLIWQRQLVFASENVVGEPLECVFRDSIVLFRAKNQPDRRVLVRLRPVFAHVVEVKMHLTGIGMRELADLQINDHKAPQFAVKEKEIDAIPFAADSKPALATDESKVAAELEQEVLKVPQERFFKVVLGVFIFQPKEFE